MASDAENPRVTTTTSTTTKTTTTKASRRFSVVIQRLSCHVFRFLWMTIGRSAQGSQRGQWSTNLSIAIGIHLRQWRLPRPFWSVFVLASVLSHCYTCYCSLSLFMYLSGSVSFLIRLSSSVRLSFSPLWHFRLMPSRCYTAVSFTHSPPTCATPCPSLSMSLYRSNCIRVYVCVGDSLTALRHSIDK